MTNQQIKNPLLNYALGNHDELSLPPFRQIKAEHIEPALSQLLEANRTKLRQILSKNTRYNWNNVIAPCEEMSNQLDKLWAVVSHLKSVMNKPQLRKIYPDCLNQLINYQIELSQNKRLYHAFYFIKEQGEYDKLDSIQQKIIDDRIRDFKLDGVGLDADSQKKFASLALQLSQLSNQFSNNVLDASQSWQLLIDSEEELQGLPQHVIDRASKKAKEKDYDHGFLLTLDRPCYQAVMSYCNKRAIRHQCYQAYITLASDQGEHESKWDNSQLIIDILTKRQKLASLLGFNHYAEMAIVTRMADSTEEVSDFLTKLQRSVTVKAKEDFNQLVDFAKNHDQLDKLKPWDISYYREKLKQHELAVNEEELRAYFLLDNVLKGMFAIVTQAYDVCFQSTNSIEVWHPDVLCFEIYHKQASHELLGYLYLDLYSRDDKQQGAWMADCCHRYLKDNSNIQLASAFLNCNFTPPNQEGISLLSHEEVVTLFHEFGHCLHHILTTIDYLSCSGINSVEWDAVELPSQYFENFCWQPDVLNSIAKHYKTGASLPPKLQENMLASRKFQAGLALSRQLLFALFDFNLHMETSPLDTKAINEMFTKLHHHLLPMMPYLKNQRFQNSFGHIFTGGYAAGYYSYLWAEVLALDAFSQSLTDNHINMVIVRKFFQSIVTQGGSKKMKQLFINFCDRLPEQQALLRYYGIVIATNH